MNRFSATFFAVALTSLALAAPAHAFTCQQHHSACLQYGHGATKCGCARGVCLKAVGSGDAGDKWNGIAGVNACFRK